MNKTSYLIKLLSVLLIAVMLLVGCSSEATGKDGAKTTAEATKEVLINKESKHEAVEAKLENFFALAYEKPWGALGTATRVDGKLVAQSDNLLVIRKADVDYMNTVTETFSVYNTALQKEVLSVQNQYQNGSYSDFDWNYLFVTDEDVKYPPSVMQVSLNRYIHP